MKDFWTMYANNMTSFLHKIIFLSENCNKVERHKRDNDEQQLRWNELSETAAKKLNDFTNQFNLIANNCSIQHNEINDEKESANKKWNLDNIKDTFNVILEQKLIMIIGITVGIIILFKCFCKR